MRAYFRASLTRMPHDPLPWWCGPFWTILIVVGALGRGTDLLLAPNESRSEIGTWVNFLGYNTYGALFCAAAVLLIASKIINRIGPFVIALALCAAINAMYGIALAQGVFLTPGPTTGWRFLTPPLLASALCMGRILALRGTVRRVNE